MTSQPPWFSRALIALSFAVAGGGSGCSFPTSSPEWNSSWVVPAEGTSISVAELLPDGVSVTPGATEFDVAVDPFTFARTLGEACGPCSAAQGQTVPKPAFSFGMNESSNLPADVVSVDVSTATVQIRATNGFDFDPIRPGQGNFGTITVTLHDGDVSGRILDVLTVSGVTESFGPGSTAIWTLSASGVIGSSVTAEVVVDSPEGDPVTVDTGTSLSIEVVPQEVRVNSVDVDIDGQGVTIDPVNLDVEDIDQGIVDQVNEGALLLDVINPFGVTINADLQVTTSSTPISRSVVLPPTPDVSQSGPGQGSEVPPIEILFNQAELQSILGHPGVSLSGTGTVISSGPVTITPDQVLDIDARIRVDISLGG